MCIHAWSTMTNMQYQVSVTWCCVANCIFW